MTEDDADRARLIDIAKRTLVPACDWPEAEKRFGDAPIELIRAALKEFDAATEGMRKIERYIAANGGTMAEALNREREGSAVEVE